MRPELPPQDIKIIFNYGGLGDDVCRLPALKFLLKDQPHVRVTLAVGDHFVPVAEHFFKSHPQITRILGFTELYKEPELMKSTWIQTKTEFFTPFRTHLVDHAFSYICDRNPADTPIEEKNYLQFDLERLPDDTAIKTKFKIPTSFALLPTGYTADVREFSPAAINGISDWLNGRGITPVYIGQKSIRRGGVADIIEARFTDDVDYSKGLDLRGQTTLLEVAILCSESRAVIGVDCGILHVAGCTGANIVAGYTNALPQHRLPIRNSVLGYKCKAVTPPGCHSCQSTVGFLPEQDYRHCVWPELACASKLTSDLFIKELEEVL